MAIKEVTGKMYYGVVYSRVPGMYTILLLTSDQTDGFSIACHAGLD